MGKVEMKGVVDFNGFVLVDDKTNEELTPSELTLAVKKLNAFKEGGAVERLEALRLWLLLPPNQRSPMEGVFLKAIDELQALLGERKE